MDRDGKRKPTSKDVARAAGVSQPTVSMILNGKRLDSFSEETIRKVAEVSAALGYGGTRGVRTSGPKDGSIVIFCPVLSNPYYPSMAQAIEQAAYKNGFRAVICTTYRNPEIEMRHLRELDMKRTAGIIFTHIPLHIKLVEDIKAQVPVVVIGDRDESIGVDTMEVNSYRSGVAVAEYLMELGHREMAFISTSLNDQNIIRVKRMEGVRDAIAKAYGGKLLVESRQVSSVLDINDLNIEHAVGYELARKCVAEHPSVTAIIGTNDMVAYGILDALHDAGHAVPEEYSVCGFDNIFPSHMSGISLSSIENFMLQKGHDAFEILLRRIISRDGRLRPENSITRVEYQPRLIVRSSTGKARETAVAKKNGSG